VKSVLSLDRIEQAEVLLRPQRVEVLQQLGEPRSCTEVATRLDQTPQRVYHHVKRLVSAGGRPRADRGAGARPQGDPHWGSLVSTWELEGSEGRTRITFVQSGFDDDRPPYASCAGRLGGVAELRRSTSCPTGGRSGSTWSSGVPDGVLATD
jgi:DNA-binding transcriptional ArsR family regulator